MSAGQEADDYEDQNGNSTQSITSIVGILTYAINGVAICAQP